MNLSRFPVEDPFGGVSCRIRRRDKFYLPNDFIHGDVKVTFSNDSRKCDVYNTCGIFMQFQTKTVNVILQESRLTHMCTHCIGVDTILQTVPIF